MLFIIWKRRYHHFSLSFITSPSLNLKYWQSDTDTNTVQHSEVVKCQPRPRPYSRRGPNHTLPTHCKPVLKLQHSRTDNSQYRQDLVWRHLGLLSYRFILLLNNEIRSQMNFSIRLKCWIWQFKKFT